MHYLISVNNGKCGYCVSSAKKLEEIKMNLSRRGISFHVFIF